MPLGDFLAPPVKKKRASRRKSTFELAVHAATVSSASGDWDGAKPRTFVGLYAVCHQMVYGIPASELDDDGEMKKAMRVAGKCQRTHFPEDPYGFASFIAWTWERQKKKEDWAITQGHSISRFTVWRQFAGAAVTDYRKSVIDRKRHGRAR